MASFWKAATLRSVLLGACASVALTAPAHAQQQQQVQFNIPAQDTASALNEFSRQAGVQILFPYDVAARTNAPAVEGSFTQQEALSRLLQGSTLRLASDDGRTVVLQDPSSPTQLGAADRAVSSGEAEETIVVTGTRIRGVGSAPSPVYAFDREDFAEQGADSVQQVLRSLPQNFNGGSSEHAAAVTSSRNGNNLNGGYGASVNLRGLGTESTLVLLNGRRLAPSGFGNFVDVAAIPLSAIERVEVVPDGASAIYGSDAVGGVVNMILRDNFEGAETQVRYASVTDGSLRQFSVNQIAGARWSSGSVLLNFDYGQSEPLLASERSFAIGLQNGVTYLSPSNERVGVLISGHQDLSPSLRLNALFHANARDVENRIWQTTSGGRQHAFEGTTDQIGGTLSLDWRVGETWTVTLAQTEHRNTMARINYLGASPTVAASVNEVHTRHDVSTTELEGEGALFDTPAGSVRLAVGAERREETDKTYRVNALGAPFALEREVTAAYAELFVPVFGETNQLPLMHRLNFSLAGRYEDYSDVGDANTYKVGALWSPIDGIDFRGTYGTSFRAPYLYQYNTSLSAAIIYGAPHPVSIVYVQGVPHPDLGPENATTLSAGFDVDQNILGVRLSATYFKIEYEDRIAATPITANAFTDPFLSALISIPADPTIVAAAAEAVQFFNFTTIPLSDVAASFDGRVRNLGRTEVSGLDLTISRDFDTAFGLFSLGANASYLFGYERNVLRGAPLVDIADTIFNPVDLRARAHFTWSRDGWSAAAFVNYVDDYTDNQLVAAPVKVSSWTTLDLGLGYRFDESANWFNGVSIRFNAQNVLDEAPPRILDRASAYGNPGYDTENANPIGRLLSLTISKAW